MRSLRAKFKIGSKFLKTDRMMGEFVIKLGTNGIVITLIEEKRWIGWYKICLSLPLFMSRYVAISSWFHLCAQLVVLLSLQTSFEDSDWIAYWAMRGLRRRSFFDEALFSMINLWRVWAQNGILPFIIWCYWVVNRVQQGSGRLQKSFHLKNFPKGYCYSCLAC